MTANKTQFCFILDKGTIDAAFISKMRKEEHYANENSCICVLWIKRKPLTENEECVRIGNDEERNSKSFVLISADIE